MQPAEGIGVWKKRTIPDKHGRPDMMMFSITITGEGINSSGDKSIQAVTIRYFEMQLLEFIFEDMSSPDLSLHELSNGFESITLTIQDASGGKYSFDGRQIYGSGKVIIDMNDLISVVSLFRRTDSYEATLEGKNWSCKFTVTERMPKYETRRKL
jgi:hypothetical protein